MRYYLSLFLGFLIFAFITLFEVNGAEDIKLRSNSPVSNETTKEDVRPGIYLVIGSFRKKLRAVKLTAVYLRHDPKVVLANVKSKQFFRVIVGPIVRSQLNVVRAQLGKEGVADPWIINIKAGEKSISVNNFLNSYKNINDNLNKGTMSVYKVKKKQHNNSKSTINPKRIQLNPEIKTLIQPAAAKTSNSIVSVEKLKSLPKLTKEETHSLKYSKSFNPKTKGSLYFSSDVARSRTINTFGVPGEIFSDCKVCPQQVVIPQGRFVMGERGGGSVGDAPAVEVVLTRAIAIGRFEVTVAEWTACANAGGCSSYIPKDKEWGLPTRPVTNVSWNDANDYIGWLSGKSGYRYRLPSEAEWEYAARAGSTSKFWWGDSAGINQAACQDCGSLYDGLIVAPVGSFSANAFGLYDTAGNLWEWTQDCYSPESYKKHKMYPQSVAGQSECSRVLRGGAWDAMTSGMYSSFRYASGSSNRSNVFGFRVARDLN